MNILILGPQTRNQKINDFLHSHGYHVSITNEKITLAQLQQNHIDYAIINGYAPILKEPIISTYSHRIINIHPTYLPYGRGIYGNFWSFFEQTPKGVSLMFIDQGIDTGDIIARKPVHLDPYLTLQTSWQILYQEVENLFCEKWNPIAHNSIQPIPQNQLNEPGSYHSRQQSENMIARLPLKWDTPLYEIEKMGKLFKQSPEKFFQTYPILNKK